jgi:hypothetical protein
MLDTLDLDIQQAVVSCFNDFAMHTSCSKVHPVVCIMFMPLPTHSSIHAPQYLFLELQQNFRLMISGAQVQREMINADIIKQELLKNAGHGRGCL